MGQFSQDFQKVIIFDCCKNDNARGNVQWFQLHSAWTHRIDCITKTISEFIFIKMTTPQTQDVNWTYIRRSEDVQDVLCTFNVRPVSAGKMLWPYAYITLNQSYAVFITSLNMTYQDFHLSIFGIVVMVAVVYPIVIIFSH